MTIAIPEKIAKICAGRGNDPHELLNILLEVQENYRCVASEAMDLIAANLGIPRVQVADVVSFYSFLSENPKGQLAIGIGNDITDEFKGSEAVSRALVRELGIEPGETTPDGLFSLEWIPYIGVPDQAPSLMVNKEIITSVSAMQVPEMIRRLRSNLDPASLVAVTGDGNNSHDLVRSMVRNNIRLEGPVIFAPLEPGSALGKAITLGRDDVLREIKTARIRGRGGAGFPAGMKWDFARRQGVDGQRYVLCNCDEGEPGTFKDRVLCTECPDLLFEGMTLCAYCIKATQGIVYLRAEYAYLRPYLEHVLTARRNSGLLGNSILDDKNFNFEISIQLGAGAYICGEETSLINSCEGLRGDPRNRPPFPVQRGYRGFPSVINNPETFCCAARVAERGAAWFVSLGSQNCPGTKLLSVSGDCSLPGVFEVPFGIPLSEVLSMAEARDPYAIVVGGPSGTIAGRKDFHRTIGYDDLATGGSVIVFDGSRDLLRAVEKFLDFFVEESCGHCTPCRVGNVLLRDCLKLFRNGRASKADLSYLGQLGETIKFASRCGLGQTSPNPILSTLNSFRDIYESRLVAPLQGRKRSFDIREALASAEEIAGRGSSYYPHAREQ